MIEASLFRAQALLLPGTVAEAHDLAILDFLLALATSFLSMTTRFFFPSGPLRKIWSIFFS